MMMPRKIDKVLVANRGEIAVRVIRTCQEMGIATVSVYSDADRCMPHVLKADEAYHIGPPPSRESYLVMEKIIIAAKQANADAIHPGYGFLAENAEFSRRVRDAGLVFIGPSPESIHAMGDKLQARMLVGKAGVPVVPGTVSALSSEHEAYAFCEQHGLPVLVKAAAGGGGKGMRIVHKVEDLVPSYRSAQSEAQSAFGDSRVYLEKYLENPRHIEFQILADEFGNVVHLGERECSIQRRHQKVIEESPSAIVDADLRDRMGATAVQAARACGYVNAGTVEFLVDKQRNFYFLEMNTRLQVEHPVTEMRTGIDLVAQQVKIARGDPLSFSQGDVQFRGHAIESRIYAEDPQNSFLPSTGTIVHLKPAQGPGVREDRGVEEGGEISVYYDPIISKLVVWAETRPDAIRRMERALSEYEILGVQTNIAFCRFVLQHPSFVNGTFDTHFVQQYFTAAALAQPSESQKTAAALLCALITHRQARQGFQPAVSGWGGGHDSAAGSGQDRPASRWKDLRERAMRS